jgi:hypothetical protein
MAKYFKKLEGLREVSHINSIRWLFGVYLFWNSIRKKIIIRAMKKEGRKATEQGPIVGPDSQLAASGHSMLK